MLKSWLSRGPRVTTHSQSESQHEDANSTPVKRKLQLSPTSGKDSKKRKTGFDQQWLQLYPWLVQTADGKGMLCRLCSKHNVRSRNGLATWTDEPCTRMNKQVIDRHAATDGHRKAVGIERDGKENRNMADLLGARVSVQRMAVEGAIRTIYWLAKHEIPHTTKFKPLLDFVTDMGCDYMKHLDQGGNAHYTSERVVQEFLSSCAAVVSDGIYEDLKKSPVFSVMVDETTDIAILKQLITYGRYLKVTNNCEVKTSFINIADIIDGTANTIMDSMGKFFEDVGLRYSECAALGSDGAAVMVGAKNGVAVKMKQKNSQLINIHCIAHRLALASSQAMNGIPYLKRFSSTLQQLFLFYQNSPVRMAGLHEIQKILGDASLRLKEAKSVRWLSHQRAVDALLKTFNSVIISLEREATERHDATAAGLASFMKRYEFIATLHMLADILPHLTRLSLLFQKKNVDLVLIDTVLHSTIIAIKNLTANPGVNMQNISDFLQDLQETEHAVTATERKKEDFKNQIYEKFISAVCHNLEERFPDMALISSFTVFDPSDLLTDDDQPQKEKLQVLINHYKLNEMAVLSEWDCLKVAMEDVYSQLTFTQMLTTVVSKFKDLTPNLYKLAAIALVLPVSTVDCERGFSALARLKTTLRNRMSEKTVRQLLFVAVEGPEESKFDHVRAADKWFAMKNRRI